MWMGCTRNYFNEWRFPKSVCLLRNLVSWLMVGAMVLLFYWHRPLVFTKINCKSDWCVHVGFNPQEFHTVAQLLPYSCLSIAESNAIGAFWIPSSYIVSHICSCGLLTPELFYFAENEDINCSNDICHDARWANLSMGRNITVTRPPLKDTVAVPVGGYVVVRIYTDNPGYWMGHCHQTVHLHEG